MHTKWTTHVHTEEGTIGIPVPAHLTPDQVDAADRFSLLVFGKLLFDREPSHNGRHGYTCEYCLPLLAANEARKPAPQPWEGLRAA